VCYAGHDVKHAVPLKPRLHDATSCQTSFTTGGFHNRLDNTYSVYRYPTSCPTRRTASLTTGWMFVYLMHPVVQPVVSCIGSIREMWARCSPVFVRPLQTGRFWLFFCTTQSEFCCTYC